MTNLVTYIRIEVEYIASASPSEALSNRATAFEQPEHSEQYPKHKLQSIMQ